MNIILIGHGSIGSRYKSCLLNMGFKKESILIVDNNKKVRTNLETDGFNTFKSIAELSKKNKCVSYGIVANWAPEHLETALDLINIGCTRLIIEKPVSNSISEFKLFLENIKKKNIFISIHFHWKYTSLINQIRKLESKYKLGSPVGMRIYGGALGLSTNGSHVLDLACDVFQDMPQTVIADLEIDAINPRDKNLVFIGGSAFYRFKNNNFINVSFSNKNSESIRGEIIYKHGKISLPKNGIINIFKRDEDAIKKFDKFITRCGDYSQVYKIEFNDPFTVKEILFELFNSDFSLSNIHNAEKSLRMVLGAIESSKLNSKVILSNVTDTGMRIS